MLKLWNLKLWVPLHGLDVHPLFCVERSAVLSMNCYAGFPAGISSFSICKEAKVPVTFLTNVGDNPNAPMSYSFSACLTVKKKKKRLCYLIILSSILELSTPRLATC